MVLVLFVLALGIGSLVLGIYTVVDASRYPDWAFTRAGSTRTVWIVLPIVFMVICGLGALIMGFVWLTSKRNQLDAAMASAGYPSPRSPQPPWAGPSPAGPSDAPPGAPPGGPSPQPPQ